MRTRSQDIYRRGLSLRGPDGAEALLDGLVAAIEGLDEFPDRGPMPPELDALGIRTYRQILLPPYRVIYLHDRQDDETRRVMVMIVADSRRDFRTLLQERVLRSG